MNEVVQEYHHKFNSLVDRYLKLLPAYGEVMYKPGFAFFITVSVSFEDDPLNGEVFSASVLFPLLTEPFTALVIAFFVLSSTFVQECARTTSNQNS